MVSNVTNPYPPLYHYTTLGGYIGIIESNCIWATKIHYLNDSLEYQHTLNLTNSVLEEKFHQLGGSGVSRQKQQIKTLLNLIDRTDTLRETSVYVACFTEEKDSLSQWRMYGGVSGIAIGFSLDSSKNLESEGAGVCFKLIQCNYDQNKQKQELQNLVDETIARNFGPLDWPAHEQPVAWRSLDPAIIDFARKLANLAPRYKHNSFRHEKEWRLVSTEPVSFKNVSFRASKSMLVPYYPLQLNTRQSGFIESIVVGPGPHLRLSYEAAVTMLYQQCGGSFGSSWSEIPYRDW